MADHFDIAQIGFPAGPEVIIKQNDKDNCIDRIQHFNLSIFNAINIEFLTESQVKKLKLSNGGSFYNIYSPEKHKLRLQDSAMLNLRLKVNLPNKIDTMIGLLPRTFLFPAICFIFFVLTIQK